MSFRILIIGGGALGAFYGHALSKAASEVAIVCRSNFEVVREAGYLIESSALGVARFIPASVLGSVAQYGSNADYLILATKVTGSLNRVALIRPAVRPGTTIVLLQNGVQIEEEIAAAFPSNEVISAVAYVSLSEYSPGRISHTASGNLVIGTYPAGKSEAATNLAALFQASGIRCTPVPNVSLYRWQKTVWNGAFNPISVLMGGIATDGILARAEPLVVNAMGEICAVAAASGTTLPPDIIGLTMESTRQMKGHVPSMSQDFLAKKEIEIEAILGNVLRIAQQKNVDVSTLQSIYHLVSVLASESKQSTDLRRALA